jgi:hypothetical protein
VANGPASEAAGVTKRYSDVVPALYMDRFAMAAQLGMLPEPQATGATA